MFRLLHVVGDSKFGGGSIIVLRLAEAAQKLGFKVDVLATDETFVKVLRDAGLGTVVLDVVRRPIRPLWDLAGALRLSRFLQNNPYTIVHTHTSKAGFVGRWAATRAGVPAIVHTVHGFPFHEASSWLHTKFYSSLERRAARWCNRLVTVSEYHREWAARLGIGTEEQRVAIPNGLSPERVVPSVTRWETRLREGIPQDAFMVLSTGRLAPQKGLEFLLDAAALVRNSRQIRIVIAGDGPLRKSLEEKAKAAGIADCVHFLGFRQDVGNLLAACDVVAVPSLWEGLSIAVLEAMAAGKAIVATTIGSNCEVLRHNQSALLVPPKNAQLLAQSLCQLAECPEAARMMGRNARRHFESFYTEDRMLQEYAQLYQSVLGARGLRLPQTSGYARNARQDVRLVA